MPVKTQMCYAFPNMKLMKEILMMQQLRHRNIVRMLGFCVRSEQTESTSLRDHGVIAVYQYGSRFDVKSLMSSSARQRLGTALEMAELLHYLQHSPLGSLRLSDFKEAHLLLTDGHVKLIDLDDWTSAEPSCRVDGRTSPNGSDYGRSGRRPVPTAPLRSVVSRVNTDYRVWPGCALDITLSIIWIR